MNTKRLIAAGALGLGVITSVAACGAFGDSSSSAQPATAASKEAGAQGTDSNNLITNQPIPIFKYSQARQTVINAETIEANGENTTTFGFSNDGKVIWHCSSIGMPVPAAAQLSNPDQQIAQPDGGGYQENQGDNVLPQMDPYGIYTGDTTGTNTLCVTPAGAEYLQYWEGYTDSVSGPASYVNGQVTLQGTPVPLKEVNK